MQKNNPDPILPARAADEVLGQPTNQTVGRVSVYSQNVEDYDKMMLRELERLNRPGELPREWATRLGFPANVIEQWEFADTWMSYPETAFFATPMTPGESLQEWAERIVGHPLTIPVCNWEEKNFKRLGLA